MLSNIAKRYFSYSGILRSKAYGRTIINPSNGFKLIHPTMFNAKSCLIFSTPSNISKVINEISQTENQHIQFVVAGTDSVIPNSNRNGVSVLWLDEPVNITGSKKLDEIPDDVMHKNWKLMESNLRLEAGKSSVFDLKLANTSFVGDLPITLFYIQPKHIELELENSGQALKELSLRLPKNVISNDSKVEEFDKWTALYDTADPFHVADFKGNLLKTINDKSAAGFLENNEKLMSIGSKDTEVYVKIYKKDSDLVYKYKVIAGGGGWGAKANIIALSPEAKINKGDRIEFYMLTPQHRFNEEQSLVAIEEYINKISIECAYEEQSYNDDTLGDELVIEKAFGAGSEEEFKYNDVKHHSSGERISIVMITYIKGDLFTHLPKQKNCISILAHACNCRGSWGGGIAAIFKIKYPDAFSDYAQHCHKSGKDPSKLLGSTLITKSTIPYVACLFTSDLSGAFISEPPIIVHNTEFAIHDLIAQIRELQHTGTNLETDEHGNVIINMPKINAGIFNVPWEDTEQVLNQFDDIHFNVYVVDF